MTARRAGRTGEPALSWWWRMLGLPGQWFRHRGDATFARLADARPRSDESRDPRFSTPTSCSTRGGWTIT